MRLPQLALAEWSAVIDIVTAVAIVFLTVALVGVTAYYAKQTRETVREMRAARGTQLLPKIVPTLHAAGAGVGWLKVINVGPGAALNVNFELHLEPGNWQRRWASAVMTSGESKEFFPYQEGESAQDSLRLDNITGRYERLRLVGSCSDALGQEHRIDEVTDIRQIWELIKHADQRLEHDPAEESSKTLKEISKALHGLHEEVRRPRLNRLARRAARERAAVTAPGASAKSAPSATPAGPDRSEQ